MVPKKIITLLFLLTIGLLIADASINGQSTIPSTAHPLETISSIMLLLSWLGALANAIKARRWKWFLALLFLSLFMLPFYLFIGPGPTRTEPSYWESHMIPRKIVALLYVLGLGLVFAGATLDQHFPDSIIARPVPYIGAILYMLAWIAALVNVVKARCYPYLTLLIFPLSLFILPVYFFLGTGPTQEASNGSPKE